MTKHFNTIVFIVTLSFSSVMHAQTNLFASILGSPNPDTTNWHFNGDAFLGDTGGDADALANEIILTPAQDNKYGQVFFKTPIDLTTCTKWRAEFEIRMRDGSGADGIAFCAINEMPNSFFVGNAMGIPITSHGLKVCFDTYDNYDNGVQCGGTNPELQISYGTGYSECDPTMIRKTNAPVWNNVSLNFLTNDGNYDKATIVYDNGTVTLTVVSGSASPSHTTQTLTGTITPISGKVYFGFTAGTGGLNNTHSIRNVRIFADVPETNNAGIDQLVCSGQTASLGGATTANHTYTWTPATDLSSASVSDPTATIINSGASPVDYDYILRTERTNAESCYMLDTVKVTVNPAPQLTENVSFCQGSSTTTHGQTITTSGTHVFLIPVTSGSGCDTTLIVNATYLTAPTSTTTETICSGNSFTFNGTSYSTTGTFSHTIALGGGCDSVATLDLTVTPPLTGTLTQGICTGGNFIYHNQTYSNAGTYTVNLQNTEGCDSIVTLTIVENAVLRDSTFTSMCQGGSYVFNGQTYTTAGNYDTQLTSSQGCDSIQTLVLTYSGVVNAYDTLNKCQNQTVTYQGQTISNAGDFTFTIPSTTGCDTTVYLHVQNVPTPTATQNKTICSGEVVSFYGQMYTTAGTYTANVSNPLGCDSVITLNLTVENSPNKPEITSNLPIPCYNQEFVGEILNPNTAFTYHWYLDTNSTTLGQGGKLTKVIDENVQTIYVNATNGTCSSIFTSIPITVSQLFNANFEMPNVITPNNDGINDNIDFDLIFGGCVEYNISIFNRWGNLVFKDGANFNGKDNKGHDLTIGTYFYKLSYDGGERSGFIQIVR
ncbi:MAG TPA: gliding motility-associated C-terminal domain-containing protein [Crocinitomicaceae bacterium]|nr:gliding motility-associated C-terminal domain-containing protein [Crocinitomicaceae bacterium]